MLALRFKSFFLLQVFSNYRALLQIKSKLSRTSQYLFGRRRWGSHVMRVQIAASNTVHKLNLFSVRNPVQWSSNSKISP